MGPVCLWKQLEIRHFEFSHWPRDRTEHYYHTSADFSEPLPICDNSEQLPQKILNLTEVMVISDSLTKDSSIQATH
jgi:hypothetical protein